MKKNTNSYINNDVNSNENQKLKTELINYKNENRLLKDKINQLKIDNDKLNEELIKANKIISNFNSNQNGNNIIINNLNELIKLKDKEINDLKNKLKNNGNITKSFGYDDILFVHFISLDQKINCPIKCLATETFAEVEEKLYKKYEEYRETNNNFVTKGKIVLRFKKICENNIQDGDKIELIKIE